MAKKKKKSKDKKSTKDKVDKKKEFQGSFDHISQGGTASSVQLEEFVSRDGQGPIGRRNKVAPEPDKKSKLSAAQEGDEKSKVSTKPRGDGKPKGDGKSKGDAKSKPVVGEKDSSTESESSEDDGNKEDMVVNSDGQLVSIHWQTPCAVACPPQAPTLNS